MVILDRKETQEKLVLKDFKVCKVHQDLKEKLESVVHKATLAQEAQTVHKAFRVSVGKTDNLDLVENEGNKVLLAYLDQSDLKDLLV